MAKPLSCADAARLLGDQHSQTLADLDRTTSGLMLGVEFDIPLALSWLESRAAFVRSAHALLATLDKQRSGLSRYDRTKRLAAAHTLIVLVAFFEKLPDLPAVLENPDPDLAATPPATPDGSPLREFVDLVFATAPELPEAQNPPEAHLAQYHAFYTQLSRALNLAVNQFPDWESRGATPRRNFRDAVITLPDRAVERYEELFRRLADDFPEVACWANLDSLADEIREIDVALTTLQGKLADISRGHAPDERRAGLARAYRADLDESIVESGEVPAGLHVPTLGDAYITPRFRVAGITAKTRPSEESWWADVPVRDTLEDFLIGFLTSPKATVAPLLVLGQPGSG